MPLFTDQEKLVLKFLISAAFVGAVVGVIRQTSLFADDSAIIDEEQSSFESTVKTIAEQPAPQPNNVTEVKEEKPVIQTEVIVNINDANVDELVTIPHVGPVTADRIVRYREDYGKFSTVEDLTRIKGIGPKTLEKIRPFVTI